MLNMTHGGADVACVSDHETLMLVAGTRVNRLVVRGLNRMEDVVCVCDCGETEAFDRKFWLSGKAIQCSSCDEWEHATPAQQIIADPETYDVLMARVKGAKDRCENPNSPSYPDYGGRGIKFDCPDLEEFVLHLFSQGWRIGDPRTIDRIDVDGPYSIENTRLALPKEQVRNRRVTVVVNAGDEVISLADLAERHGIDTQSGEYAKLSRFAAKSKRQSQIIYDDIIEMISELTGEVV